MYKKSIFFTLLFGMLCITSVTFGSEGNDGAVLVKKDAFLLGFSIDDKTVEWYDPNKNSYLQNFEILNEAENHISIKDGAKLTPRPEKFNELSITTSKTTYTFDLESLPSAISQRIKQSIINETKFSDSPFLLKPLRVFDAIRKTDYTILKYGLEKKAPATTIFTSSPLSSLSTSPSSWNPNLIKIGGVTVASIIFFFIYLYLTKKA